MGKKTDDGKRVDLSEKKKSIDPIDIRPEPKPRPKPPSKPDQEEK